MKWEKTGTRGTKRKYSDEEIEAAHNLLFLAYGPPYLKNDDMVVENIDKEQAEQQVDKGIQEVETLACNQQNHELDVSTPPKLSVNNNEEVTKTATMKTIENTTTGQEARTQCKRIKMEKPNATSKRIFTCKICNKSFNSSQALGGHVSSHTKGKANEGEGGDRAPKKTTKPTNGLRMYCCNKCTAAFRSGQSLGGHKRKHYKKETDDNQPQATVTLENVDQASSRNVEHTCMKEAEEGGAKDNDVTDIINRDACEVNGEHSSGNDAQNDGEKAPAKNDGEKAPAKIVFDFDLNLPAEM